MPDLVIKKPAIKGLKLYQSIAVLILVVIFVSLTASYILLSWQLGSMLSQNLGANATKVANAIQNSPTIIQALQKKPLDEKALTVAIADISNATNASIVIFDQKENILAIYNPTNAPLLNASAVADSTIGILKKLPSDMFRNNKAFAINDGQGNILGYVVVGFPENMAANLSGNAVNLMIIPLIIGLIVGIFGAYFLANKIKVVLFGCEPMQIADLLQERITLLNTIEEAVFVVDKSFSIYLANNAAKKLLNKSCLEDSAQIEGKNFALISSIDTIAKVFKSGIEEHNLSININGLDTIGSMLPVKTNKNITAVIIMVSEKDSLKYMAEQLTGVYNYADALRAQTHEFMNKMHVISGLLQCNEIGELRNYINSITQTGTTNTDDITNLVKEPLLSGFLIGKKSRANELAIDFTLAEESSFPADLTDVLDVHDIILVVGNLLENAFDALQLYEGEKIVILSLFTYDDEFMIVVENSGPSIDNKIIDSIFTKDFTTKGPGHGLGLTMVKETIDKLKGQINVESSPENGTCFTVRIPLKEDK